MINKIKKYWELLIILFLGLTPLLWYKNPNSLALGHDMGFPVDPIIFFKDRLFLWTDRVGLGWDQTLGSAAVLIHGIEALIASFGLPVFIVQKIVFIFWFVLPGLAMYYFVSTVHKKKEEWFIRLGASLFYMFNHFLLQAWFIAERTKISLLIALPLLLGLTLNIVEKKISTLKGLTLISLVFFFFNGGGGVPLYGGLLLTLTLGFLFFASFRLRKNFREELKRLALITLGIVGSFILANFYWILPTFIKIFSSYRESLSSIGGISGVLAWSFEISKFASILNLIRLQGIPDWYDNPLHPYSKLFLENPFLILISFLIPVIVFLSLFLVKKVPQYRKHVIFFNLLAIFGIVFTAGSHPPFGAIYNLFLSFVPGFAIFRTPFYKFAPALWFAYAYLFSFSIYYLTERFKNFKTILRLSILPLILIYSFPFFTGSFFNWKEPFSTMTNLPSYVLDFGKWTNSNLSFNDRVLTFPKLNQEWRTAIYRWGYWSTAPLPSLFTDKSIIANDRVMTEKENIFVNNLYDSIVENTSTWKKVSELLGVNYFLLYNDFYSDAPKIETENPALYKKNLASTEGVTKKQSFGAWDLYQVTDSNPKKLFISENTSLVLTKKDLNDNFFDTDSILFLPESEKENFYFTNEIEKKEIPEQFFSRVIFIESCLYCDRREEDINLTAPKPNILYGSIFYPLIKNREQKEEEAVKGDYSKQIDFYLGSSLKRVGEVNQLILLKQKEENVIFTIEEIKNIIKKIDVIIRESDKNDVSTQLSVLKINNFLRAENRALDDIAKEGSSKIKDQITFLRDYIADFYQKNSVFEFTYPPDKEKEYSFNIETSGSYEILSQRRDFGQELSFQRAFIDGKEILSKPVPINYYYLSFGKHLFSKGKHNLKFEIEDIGNIVKEISSFSITPTNQKCQTFIKNNIYPNHKYIFSFDYVTEKGTGDTLLSIGQFSDQKELLPSRMELGSTATPRIFKTNIVTQSNVNKLEISLCPSPGYENFSTTRISNMRLEPVIMPLVAVILDKSMVGATSNYSVDRINPTKYNISVKKANVPNFLVLNTAFNSDWKLSFDDDEKISEDEHIIINGFSNGWVIDKKGDYEATIEYYPQKYFYIGWIVTGIFMILSLSYLFYKRNEKN